MNTKQFLCLLLALAITLSTLFISCAAPTDEKGQSSASETGETVTEAESGRSRINAEDRLPADLNLHNRTVRILCRTGDGDTKMEFVAENGSSDVVEAAVYERNKIVAERLQVEFEIITVSDTRHSGAAINSKLATTVTTQTDEYDIVANHLSQTTTSVLAGYLCNLKNLTYFDWEQPWWNASYSDCITVDGKQYLAAGEMNLSFISGAFAMFFNKYMWENYYSADNLYEIVKSGEWTLDKLMSYTTDFWQDTDGVNGLSENDIIGLYHATSSLSDAFAGSCGVRFTEYDADTDSYVFVLGEDRTYTFVDKMKKLLFDTNAAYIGPDNFQYGLDKLMNDTALFTPNILGGTAYLRSMSHDYGIIPLPKLDEEQVSYSGFVQNGCSVVGIPATAHDADEISAVCEALCSESYRRVTTAYYDTALKYKYTRDSECVEMLDLIIGSIRFDFAYCYNQSLNTVAALFRDMFSTAVKAGKASSTIRNYERKTETAIKNLVRAIEKLTV